MHNSQELLRSVFPVLLALFICDIVQGNENVRLKLNQGEIKGKPMRTVGRDNPYYSFQGIPYAKPPLGDLRLAPPQPAEKWSGVLDATKPASTCIEMPFSDRGQEDCLYLNVFTPSLNKSLPVMVWIHGGSFVFIFDHYTLNGSDFFMDEEVILVTVHYRLGAFGFLSTEDDVMPGNYGFKDQVMAVNWVYDNIKELGGDPKRITLMGQSGGSVSVTYMGMSPQLQGKIHGIIQQSGSPICPYGIGRYNRMAAFMLSTRLGLRTTNSTAVLETLRKADAEALRSNSLAIYEDIIYGMGAFQGLLYMPAIEPKITKDPFITEPPYERFRRGKFNRIPRMMGITSLEGIYMTETFETNRHYYSNNYDQNVKNYIPLSMNSKNEYVGKLIRKHYTNDKPFLSNITNAVRYGSDDQFVRCIMREVDLISKYVKTYLYQFSYAGRLGWETRPLKGVSHGEELQYLFRDGSRVNIPKEDKVVRRKLLRLWTNFAKYGDPTPHKEKLLDDQLWSSVDPDSKDTRYMDIGANLRPLLNPHKEDVEFWNNLYSTYGNPPFETY